MADLLLSDLDSGFNKDCNTEDTSRISDKYPFRHENGRRFHSIASCPYPFPNDGEEMRRLDRFHDVYYQIFGKRNILVPLQNPQLILDMGTGSGSSPLVIEIAGTWMDDVSTDYPSTRICGIDLAPVQHSDSYDTVECIVGDITDGALDSFDTGSVDLIHSRMICLGVTIDQWPALIADVFRLLVPGIGWAQCVEMSPTVISDNNSLPQDCILNTFSEKLKTFAETRNLRLDGEMLKELLDNAGFVDVKVIERQLDMGPWRGPKHRTAGIAAREAFTAAILPFLLGAKEIIVFPDDE